VGQLGATLEKQAEVFFGEIEMLALMVCIKVFSSFPLFPKRTSSTPAGLRRSVGFSLFSFGFAAGGFGACSAGGAVGFGFSVGNGKWLCTLPWWS
jgi:hypothetical protein